MAVNYQKLFNVLEQKHITLTKMSEDLQISSVTRAKFKKNEYVSLQTLEALCLYLNVSLDDIVTFEIKQLESALYKRLKEEMEHKVKGSIYQETQIVLTFNSNHIEGSTLTHDQTRYIFETNTIGLEADDTVNIDDIIETKNHFKCIDYMIKTALDPISETMIKDLHRLLKAGTTDEGLSWFNVGDYKKQSNTVGGSTTSDPSLVENHMQALIKWYHGLKTVTFEDLIEFHYHFEKIHPFQDGNGRVGRLLAFKECLKNNLIPFTINERIKMYYYRGLKAYKEEKGYLIDTCLKGQDEYKKLLDMFEII